MDRYDLVVIGAGVGLMVIEAALAKGLTCALIEQAKVGGTCLTKGCIPSKILVFPADMIRESQAAYRVGLDYSPPRVDWEVISRRMWSEINLSHSIEKSLRAIDNLAFFKGTAEFTGPATLQVHDPEGGLSDPFTGDRIVIAAGARSNVPPIPGLKSADFVTPESFFGDKFPARPYKSLAIIGGGPIGAEFAHIFSAMGSHVTLIEARPRLLAAEEEEISAFVEKQFRKNDIDVYTNTAVLSAGRDEQGKFLTLAAGDSRQITVECEEIFIAAGTHANSDLLQLDKTGVVTDTKGWIITDEFLETSQKGIWAIGDINGKFQLRHKANFEAEILIRNLFGQGEKAEITYHAVPWAVFTCPQVAHVGLTEHEIKGRGKNYWVGYNHYSAIAGGIAMGYAAGDEDDGFVKILVDDERRIVGLHIAGPHAAILLQPFVYLMNAGQKCRGPQSAPAGTSVTEIKGLRVMCPPLGTYQPINDSMVIHPSLNELTAWVIENIDWSDTRS